jgi:glycerol-3-phosphate dehydrogenase (NAD(P)+)
MSIIIIGQGAWGLALGQLFRTAGQTVTLLHHGDALPPGAHMAIVVALPAQHIRESLKGLAVGETPIILASKGIEQHSGALLPEVVREVCVDAPILVLSGPSFAAEVLAKKPIAMTLAGHGETLTSALAAQLSSRLCRLYISADVTGVAVGGALKNVLALACGIAIGGGYGENARAAIFTRGLAEIVRFGIALGADAATFLGLSGVGDMVLSCTSTTSRNYSYGLAVGSGGRRPDPHTLTEGVATAAAVLVRAQALDLPMPVAAAVQDILSGKASVPEAVEALLKRPGGRGEGYLYR